MHKSVGRMVSILYRKNQVYLNRVLKPLNITASEAQVVTYLFYHEGASQEELSSYLMIDKGATARAIQALIKKGYVRKAPDPVDRRANCLYPTEQAQDIKPKLDKQFMGWTAFLTNGLSAHDVDTMFCVLDSMVKKVEHTDFEQWMGRHESWNK